MAAIILLVLSGSGAQLWTPRTQAAGQWSDGYTFSDNVSHVAYGDGSWLVLGDGGLYAISDDGTSWEEKTFSKCGGVASVYAAGKWYVVCNNGYINVSENLFGSGWDAFLPAGIAQDSAHFFSAASDGTAIVAVGSDNDWGNEAVVTYDGTAWSSHELGDFQYFSHVIYANGRFMALGLDRNDQSVIYSSPDGKQWSPVPGLKPEQPLYSMAYGKGLMVAVGGNGYVYKSADGVTWEGAYSGVTHNDLYSIAFGEGMFYAVGTQKTIISSVDGQAWALENEETNAVQYTYVAVGNKQVFAAGENGVSKRASTIPLSSNNRLSSLQISPGSLNFDPVQEQYTVEVPYGTAEATVTPAAEDAGATIKVGGTAAASGQGVRVALEADGSTAIQIEVTASDGSIKTYTITVNEIEPSHNAYLSAVQVSPGAVLDPSPFTPAATEYDVLMDEQTESLTMTPVTEDSTATMRVIKGASAAVPWTGGNPYSFTLGKGESARVQFIVTAQDGNTAKTYTFNVQRASSTNAQLADIKLTTGTLTPLFDPGKTDYSVQLPFSAAEIGITPVLADSLAFKKVRVDGQEVTESELAAIPLTPGTPKSIEIEVTAQDPAVQRTYKLTVTRAKPSADATLSSLSVNGVLIDGFQSERENYGMDLPFTKKSIDVSWVLGSPGTAVYKVRVDGQEQNVTNLKDLPLSPGIPRVIEIVVTAEDTNVTRTYKLTVARAQPSADATLSNLRVDGIAVVGFRSDLYDYTVNVPYTKEKADVDWVLGDPVSATYKVRIDGAEASPGSLTDLPLSPGTAKNIEIIVTAQDPSISLTYTLAINRATPSGNAYLGSLEVSPGARLEPSPFVSSILEYDVLVEERSDRFTITPTLADPTASMRLKQGTQEEDWGSGRAYTPVLGKGETAKLEFVVTAQNGTTHTYRLNVVRAASTNAKLRDIRVMPGTLNPPFDPDDYEYSVQVPYAEAGIDIVPQRADALSTMKVKVDGQNVDESALSGLALVPGVPKVIEITVTAQDPKVHQSYRLTVTRLLRSSNAALDSLKVDGVMVKDFQSGTLNYSVHVPYAKSAVNVNWTLADQSAASRAKVDGQDANAPELKGVLLTPGIAKVVEIVVTAEDGTVRAYRLTITRAKPDPVTPPSGPSPSGPSLPSGPVNPTAPSMVGKIEVIVDHGPGTAKAAELIMERMKNAGGIMHDKLVLTAAELKKAISASASKVRVVIPDPKDEASRIDVEVPYASLKELQTEKKELEIHTDHVRMLLSKESIQGLDKDIYFRVIPVKEKNSQDQILGRALKEAAQKISPSRQPSIVARPIRIESNISGSNVTVILPLQAVKPPLSTAEREAFQKSLVIFIERSDGEHELVRGKLADDAGKQEAIQFTVPKFGTFAVLRWEGQNPGELPDRGSGGHPSHEAYIFGFSDGTFRPSHSLTRSQLASMLARLLGYDGKGAVRSGFADVDDAYWAAGEIEFVSRQGFMIGDESEKFRPDEEVTRAQMAMIASRYKQLDADQAYGGAFSDVADEHWAEGAIAASKQAGLISGYPDGTFRPGNRMTRAEAVVLLNKMFDRLPLSGKSQPSWTDVPATHWAYGDIEEASGKP